MRHLLPLRYIDAVVRAGSIRKAAEALGNINIETVVTIDKQPGNKARISLGFRKGDLARAQQRLEAAGIEIHKHHHSA